jgi:uncharacterized membrane protein
MRAPRSFVASAHANRQDAEAALRAVEDLAREGVLELADAAVVVKTDSGRIELHQRRELSPGEGAVGGGVIGVVAGVVLGLPFVLPAAGVALGAGAGAFDRGIDNARMRQLGADLEPGHAALCALVGKADWPAVRERMAPYAGELLVAELSPEAAAALQAARAEGPASSGD